MMKKNDDMQESSKRTEAHLEAALAQLPAALVHGDEGGSIEQCRDWIKHNELALALDELEMLGEANPTPEAFWRSLLAAAQEMNLERHCARYRKRLTG
jgi:hypothetical protein